MIVGGAIVNALAFSGSNALFSLGSDDERKRHNKFLEQQQAEHEEWTRKRSALLE